MLLSILLFLVGLLCLIKGGDWFVEGASALARRFHLPELLIGATVVSIGTTLPEVMVSTMSAVSGHGEIAYGNAIGSVICNAALIAAITIAVRPGPVDPKTLRTPVAFFFAAAAIYCVAAYGFGKFTRPMGLVMLALFVAYMAANVAQMTRTPAPAEGPAEAAEAEMTMAKTLVLLVAGAVLIAVHARTREQMYTPGIDPSIIAAVKDAVHVPVLGNGDIRTAEDAVRMVEETGCDGVMIARAALGDPWLFERVNAALEGLPAPKEPNLQARMNALRRQVEEMVEQKGEFVAMPQARAQTMHYMKGLKGAAALRRYCCTLTHLEDLDELIAAVFEEQRKAGLDPDDVREVPFP